jgi:hypothetical protein
LAIHADQQDRGHAEARPMAPPIGRVSASAGRLTACVFGSGVMVAVTGPSYGPPSGWLVLHRLSFIAWACVMPIHVLAYVPRLPRLLLGGLVIALLTVHLAGNWQ